MSSQAKAHMSVEEYLSIGRQATSKSEYFNGEIFTMSGASRRHNLISLNIATRLHTHLQDRLPEVYTSDMRVKVARTGLYIYPDIVVSAESPTFEDAEVDTLQNPILLCEVLSKNTEDYDRGRKFEHYRTLSSLQDYLLVAQDRYHVMHYTRQSTKTWLMAETFDIADKIQFPSLDSTITLSEIYAKVSFAH